MSSHPRFRLAAALIVTVALVACGGGGRDDAPAAGAGDTPATTASVNAQALYTQRCGSCHQANGEGLAGVYPPLAGSEYSTSANAAVPIRIVLKGLQGPITVKGVEYNSLMPAYGLGIEMSDAEVAGVITYVRTSWGNSASAVTAADVAREREATKDHTGAVTVADLRPLMGR